MKIIISVLLLTIFCFSLSGCFGKSVDILSDLAKGKNKGKRTSVNSNAVLIFANDDCTVLLG